MPSRWSELLAPADPAIVEAGAGGERLVARMRVVFWATVWLIPLVTVVIMPDPPPEVGIGLVATTAALLVSLVLAIVLRRPHGSTPIALATSAFDVTLVTAALVAIALAGRPMVAVNSLVVWAVYLLAILATALRFDLRVCLVAGLLSVVEYLGLLLWAAARWDLDRDVPGYGSLSWPVQLGRLILQLGAAALAAGLVHQSNRLARVAGTDRLTGLGNRTAFDERLASEVALATRSESKLAVAFLDVDRFKRFNDDWGHDAGDAALRTVADAVREEGRRSDAAFRWGGEEIVLLLPETGLEGALRSLARVRERLLRTPLVGLPEEVRLTVSAGVATFPGDGRSPETLVAAADRRLLRAKREGRDRVVGD